MATLSYPPILCAKWANSQVPACDSNPSRLTSPATHDPQPTAPTPHARASSCHRFMAFQGSFLSSSSPVGLTFYPTTTCSGNALGSTTVPQSQTFVTASYSSSELSYSVHMNSLQQFMYIGGSGGVLRREGGDGAWHGIVGHAGGCPSATVSSSKVLDVHCSKAFVFPPP